MDLAAQLREKGDSCALIFVTSSDAFAVASYDVQAAYYLLKPLDTNKLIKVLDSIQIIGRPPAGYGYPGPGPARHR